MKAFFVDGGTTFEKLAYDLLSSDDETFVSHLGTHHIEIAFAAGNKAALFRYAPGQESALRDEMRARMKAGCDELVVIGGPDDQGQLFKSARPLFLPRECLGYTLQDDGHVWQYKRPLRKGPVGRELERGVVGAPNEEKFRAMMSVIGEQQAKYAGEANAFSSQLKSTRPIATYALIVVIGVMYGLETLFGGATNNAVLSRLGALQPSLVSTQPWRLFSHAFLHIGPVHVLLNCYVLFVIGGFLERVIGAWRFLVVFWLSVLGGAFAVMLSSSAALTAGASGGIFGLLAAQSVLAFRPHGLLPQTLIPNAKRAAITNFLINAVNSLRANISMAAHVGGGVVGAALFLSPFFVRGLPKLDERGAMSAPRRVPSWIRVLAIIGVVAMASSLVAAVLLGGALKLLHPEPKRVPIGSGLTAMVRSDLECVVTAPAVAYGTQKRTVCGELPNDPISYTVVVVDFGRQANAADYAATLASEKKAIEKTDATFNKLLSTDTKRVDGREILIATFGADVNPQARRELAMTMTSTRELVVRVVMLSPNDEGAALRAITSIE